MALDVFEVLDPGALRGAVVVLNACEAGADAIIGRDDLIGCLRRLSWRARRRWWPPIESCPTPKPVASPRSSISNRVTDTRTGAEDGDPGPSCRRHFILKDWRLVGTARW
ncbi:MAG: hypothetical protein H6703_08455 [Myxococcales bacterium]|nr:hypothetical protein [Myxococcales bacterium]